MKLNDWLKSAMKPNERLKFAEKNLRHFLKRFHKLHTMLAFWEIQRLQSSKLQSSRIITGLPSGGLGNSIHDNKPYFFPWMIEQSINLISVFGSNQLRSGATHDIFQWNNLALFYNLVREYNDARSGTFLQTGNIFETLSKIGRQQFPWQDGSLGTQALEMHAALHLGQICEETCLENYGIKVSDFLSYGFLMQSQFIKNPILKLPYDMSHVDGDQRKLKIVLDRYSTSSNSYSEEGRMLRKDDPLGEYSKSLLRMKPIIKINDNSYCCPIPKLIQFRITSGLISETFLNDAAVNEVANNFEIYCFDKFSKAFPSLEIEQEVVYGSRQRSKKTPDIRLYEEATLKLIVECKATLLQFEEKFVNTGLDTLPKKSDQIIKGIIQIWKYVRDVNENIAPDNKISTNCKGLVLTLEQWIAMDKNRHKLMIDEAHKIADDTNIPTDARIDTTITSIKDVFYILEHTNFNELLECLNNATDPEFNGYLLQNVFNATNKNPTKLRGLVSNKILNEKIWYWEKAQETLYQ